MKTHPGITILALAIGAGYAAAAEPETRDAPSNPDCSDRNANPEKCVIQDGPPPLPIVRKKPQPAPLPSPARAPSQPNAPAENVRQTAPLKTN